MYNSQRKSIYILNNVGWQRAGLSESRAVAPALPFYSVDSFYPLGKLSTIFYLTFCLCFSIRRLGLLFDFSSLTKVLRSIFMMIGNVITLP